MKQRHIEGIDVQKKKKRVQKKNKRSQLSEKKNRTCQSLGELLEKEPKKINNM